MRQTGDVKTRRVTPPSPAYMNNDEFASYLTNLRNNRVARPGGARPPPPSSRPLAKRSSIDGYSHSAFSQEKAHAGHQRAQSTTPSIAGGSVSSRFSNASTHSQDYYTPKPSSPPPKPNEVIPTATYMERGSRWMEKEEAYSLRDAMDELALREAKKKMPAEDDETRLYNAALDEAAELVWQHQHVVRPQPPDGPYRYRPHLRKDSYAHARAASLSRHDSTTRAARDSISGRNSTSAESSEEDDTTKLDGPLSESSRADRQNIATMKSYGSIGGRFAGGRRSSMKRNISGEVEKPFSGDQIWEEPEAQSNKASTPIIAETSPVGSLGRKTPNAKARLAQESRPGDSSPTKPLERIEIYKNPPTRSRNAQYRVNDAHQASPLPDVQYLNGVEIRAQDIRAATSVKLRDRSPNLPEPTAVSDSPGRPIVSFDANWKPPEESTDVNPERPTPNSVSTASKPQAPTMEIPTIIVAEDPSPQPRAPASANVPSISIAEPDEPSTRPIPAVEISSIVVDNVSGRRDFTGAIASGDSPAGKSPTKISRPLPTPGAPVGQGRELPRPRGHWSPASTAASRATTLCHECCHPIEGKFVALTGCSERFHPGCFRCYTCHSKLEAMEISPEPEAARNKRLVRIRRRAVGDILEEKPGETMGEDGDERLRFYCHLDWHEHFAPRCKHCQTPILGEHIVALGSHWHYGHFFCAECGDPFEHGMTHIEKDGYAWCINCQTRRTERRAPKCKMCKTAVIGQYIMALGGEWHEHCFRCAECQGGFDDGQIFPKEVDGSFVVLCTSCRTRELKF